MAAWVGVITDNTRVCECCQYCESQADQLGPTAGPAGKAGQAGQAGCCGLLTSAGICVPVCDSRFDQSEQDKRKTQAISLKQ